MHYLVLDGSEFRHIEEDKGLEMALGNLDINTLERIDNFNPDKPNVQVGHRKLLSQSAEIQCESKESMCFQRCKARSNSWNGSAASTGPSIWSRGFTPTPAGSAPRPAASPDRPPSTRGKERVVSLGGLKLPSREQQVKRSREGELPGLCAAL